MLTPQKFTASHAFSATVDKVFDAILPHKTMLRDTDKSGAILSVERLCGTERTVGSQIIIRLNWGAVDLEVNEAILAINVPHLLRIRRRPLRYSAINFQERMPRVGDTSPDNIEDLFISNYGEKPAATEQQFDLEPTPNGTKLTLTSQIQPEIKFGKFARWVWTRRMKKDVKSTFRKIEAALSVQ